MGDLQIIDCEQGTDEWHGARLGLVTASQVSSLLVNGKSNHGFGSGAITYMYELLTEDFTGEPAQSFSNAHTERGHADEDTARSIYELRQEVQVEQCGFMIRDNLGYSPDGVVGSDGLIEVKSKMGKHHIATLIDGNVPKEHIAQIQTGLLVSGRKWCDYIQFCKGMPIYIERVERDETMIENIADRVAAFYSLKNEYKLKLFEMGNAA